MMQMAVLSGKGGTGKTTVTASFASLSTNAVFADCDVDASNLHLLLQPKIKETIEFKGLDIADIDSDKCPQCGLCEERCRFDAFHDFQVDSIHCEGCGVCAWVCSEGAISMIERICGQAYISDTKYGPMSHARLGPGMENSGKLVSLVKQNAKKIAEENHQEIILIDCPPGIGCPVIASLSDVKLGLVVVEPTLSGIHDLKRALQLLDHFNVEPIVCVNKHDINMGNTKSIQEFCREENIEVAGLIPFDPTVTKAMVVGKPVVEFDPYSPASLAIVKLWDWIRYR